MAWQVIVLVLAPFLAGMAVFVVPQAKETAFKMYLVFAGAFLFSITISHLLPEAYNNSLPNLETGAWILLGFFLQLMLESFSGGIEHGHLPTEKPQGHSHGPHYHGITLLLALSLHALLDGTVLAHPEQHHGHDHNANSLFIGIVLHKLPAAFALMSLLRSRYTRAKSILFLTIFTAASPLGWLLGTYFFSWSQAPQGLIAVCFALLSGSFFHISTTIFYESTMGPSLGMKRWLVALLGASIALLLEWLV